MLRDEFEPTIPSFERRKTAQPLWAAFGGTSYLHIVSLEWNKALDGPLGRAG
jgi:hypothetical protein